jgi:hypothetical protein
MHTDEGLLPQLQWESKIIRLLVSHNKYWNADFGNNYNFRTGPPVTQIPHAVKKIYATFVLTTACGVIFAMNMDASAIYWPNFRHYSTSLTFTASRTSQAQRPTTVYVCTRCSSRSVKNVKIFRNSTILIRNVVNCAQHYWLPKSGIWCTYILG